MGLDPAKTKTLGSDQSLSKEQKCCLKIKPNLKSFFLKKCLFCDGHNHNDPEKWHLLHEILFMEKR